jgi:plastocyanin
MDSKAYVRVVAIAAALVAAIVLRPTMGLSREHDREVRMVALDRTFYIDGQSTPNPTLTLRAGERVRLVLRNEDEGMRHDLKIREWNVAVPAIDGKGERTITFRVPDSRGAASYACTPHSSSMLGSIEVE